MYDKNESVSQFLSTFLCICINAESVFVDMQSEILSLAESILFGYER